MKNQEFVICLAMDAFRLCLGMRPRNFTKADIIKWLRAMPESEGG
jgi:hypothetical protein